MPFPALGPMDVYELGSARRKNVFEHGQRKAQIELNRGNVQANQALDVGDITRKWDVLRERLPGGFAKRGLLNSGIYGTGLSEYGQNRQAAFSQLSRKYQDMLSQLDLQELQGEQALFVGQADVNELERARTEQNAQALWLATAAENERRAELAAQLRAMGG